VVAFARSVRPILQADNLGQAVALLAVLFASHAVPALGANLALAAFPVRLVACDVALDAILVLVEDAVALRAGRLAVLAIVLVKVALARVLVLAEDGHACSLAAALAFLVAQDAVVEGIACAIEFFALAL
jgi:hypothetical protein